MNTNVVKVGLIGLGYWGPNLLRNLLVSQGVKVVACADLDEKRLQWVKRMRPEIFLTTTYQTLLTQDLAAVVISTPPSTHFRLAKDALNAGKHVLVEKPMTTTYAEALKLVTLAQKKKQLLMVDHVFVYSAPVAKLKELIDQKALGDIYYFDSTRVNLGLFQKDTNVLWDLACHDLSILEYLFPMRPVSISCIGKSHTRSGQTDIAYLTIQYSGHFLAHINVNWLAPTKIRRIIIGGSRKMVVYDEGNVEERVKVYDKGIFIDNDLRHKALVNYRIGEVVAPFVPADEALSTVCRHFVECIKTKQTPMTDGNSGAQVVRLLEWTERSLESGKTISIISL